jgi:hypothetical protein
MVDEKKFNTSLHIYLDKSTYDKLMFLKKNYSKYNSTSSLLSMFISGYYSMVQKQQQQAVQQQQVVQK